MSIWDFLDDEYAQPSMREGVPQLHLIIWTSTGQSANYLRDTDLLTDADRIGPRIAALEQRHPGQNFIAVTGDDLPWACSLPAAPLSTLEQEPSE